MYEGKHLRIPYRIYEGPTNPVVLSLFPRGARELRLCSLTRHYDGHVRERYIKVVMAIDNPVVAPYIIRLCGEYVIEILYSIQLNLASYNHGFLRSFILENRRFYEKNRRRMVSYWDCYYRSDFPKISDYVGYRIFTQLDEIAQDF